MASSISARANPGARISSRWFHSLALFFVGISLIFVVGFAPANAIHNAAHDTRHAFAFPCH